MWIQYPYNFHCGTTSRPNTMTVLYHMKNALTKLSKYSFQIDIIYIYILYILYIRYICIYSRLLHENINRNSGNTIELLCFVLSWDEDICSMGLQTMQS